MLSCYDRRTRSKLGRGREATVLPISAFRGADNGIKIKTKQIHLEGTRMSTHHPNVFLVTARKMALAALAVLALAAAPFMAQAKPLTITLLGTGSPAPNATRFSQSILVEAGDGKYLIDLG